MLYYSPNPLPLPSETRPHEISAGYSRSSRDRCHCRDLRGQPADPSSGPRIAPAQLPSTPASYLGVYEAGALTTYQPVANFTKAASRQPNLVGYYSGWGEHFETSFAETARRHGAATIMQWDPTLASVSKIADGGYDSYLRSFAGSVRDFGHPVVIGFGHEMNAYWYSWGYRHLPAPTFVAAWRHIVTLFRAQHADNVTWLWTLQADEPGTGPIASWWPGAKYVTWVGIDGYYYGPSENFFGIFGKTIAQVRTFTGLPVLLSEVAVGPKAGQAPEDPRPVRRHASLRHARARLVRHRPAPGDIPPGLAHRRQPGGGNGVPACRLCAGPNPAVTAAVARPLSGR